MALFRRRARPAGERTGGAPAGADPATERPTGAARHPVAAAPEAGGRASSGSPSPGPVGGEGEPSEPSPDAPSATHGRPMTMEERIQAFFRQSGGPNNPQIPKLVEKHLLYGKDHGIPGYRETFADAFIDAVVGDPSLLLLYERVQRWRAERQRERRDAARAAAPVATDPAVLERLERLEQEVARLRRAVERLGAAP